MDNRFANTPYYLGFSHIMGIGPVKFDALVKNLGSIKKAYEGSPSEIKEIVGSKLGEEFVAFRSRFDPVKKLEELNKKGIRVIPREDSQYPAQLRNIEDSPICLYAKGDLSLMDFGKDRFFAIVGTRKATEYGRQITHQFSKELVECGFVIVSGLAYGIDAVAHKAALETEGRTIAFLGCGVDIPYPYGNKGIYERIVEDGGLVMSEFPPGQTVAPGLFIARNRLISGLSMGVLIVEGPKNSGALITARYAAEQGKDVFAVPSPLTSVMSEAPNILLKQGAKLVTSVHDILEEYGLKKAPRFASATNALDLDKEQRAILTLLEHESKYIDDLVLESGFNVDRALNILSSLEILGVVERDIEAKYQVKFV